ncbi:MAG TPA: hypothetical protein VER03_20370 [Bryobacteraceae bacterium]|nr:hypothetical protein [Bryobacteraceae bacterium]
MSTTQFSFKAKIKVGEEIVPLISEVVVGTADAQGGVANGFLFKLDIKPEDPPLFINLGDMIAFIENKLGAGAGTLSQNPNLQLLEQAFPDYIGGSSPFTSQNQTLIQIQSFELNSTTKEFLFSFSVDVLSADPTQGLISLPAELASWVTIKNLAISFSATSSS